MREPVVNLLPGRRQTALRRAGHRRDAQRMLLVLAGLGLGWGLLAWGQARSWDQRVQLEHLQLQPLRQRQAAWQKLDQEEKNLLQWAEVEDRLRGQVPPASVLAWLSTVVPGDVGLTRLTFEQGGAASLRPAAGARGSRRSASGTGAALEPERVRVELAGITLREAAVEELIEHLAHSGLCQDLRLEATRRAAVRQQLVHELHVSWQIPAGGGSAVPARLAGRLP